MADDQRNPKPGRHAPPDNTTDDDLNREDITPGERDIERGYRGTVGGQGQPTDPDSAFSDVDRDDSIDD